MHWAKPFIGPLTTGLKPRPPGHAGRGHGPAAHTPEAPRHTERVLRPHCSPKPVCPECPRACWAAGAAALAGWGRASRRGHVGEDRPCGVVDAALPSADPDPRGGAGPTPHCPGTPPCPCQWLPACLQLPVSCLHSWLPRPRARSPTAASVARRAPSVSPPTAPSPAAALHLPRRSPTIEDGQNGRWEEGGASGERRGREEGVGVGKGGGQEREQECTAGGGQSERERGKQSGGKGRREPGRGW